MQKRRRRCATRGRCPGSATERRNCNGFGCSGRYPFSIGFGTALEKVRLPARHEREIWPEDFFARTEEIPLLACIVAFPTSAYLSKKITPIKHEIFWPWGKAIKIVARYRRTETLPRPEKVHLGNWKRGVRRQHFLHKGNSLLKMPEVARANGKTFPACSGANLISAREEASKTFLFLSKVLILQPPF